MKLDTESFIRVSQIIERDSKDTTYKFALLRATIDVISLYDQQIINLNGRVLIPTGLIIERWIWYYYPLIDSNVFLPQKNSEPEELTRGKNISFRKNFIALIDSYSEYGKFEHFYNDYKKKNLHKEVNVELSYLVSDLYKTITSMPMRYVGKSFSKDEYSIYNIEKKKNRIKAATVISTEILLKEFGSFSIPIDFYFVLKYLGSFISGSNTLINNWADFIVKANKTHHLDKEYVLKKLFKQPESFRDVNEVKKFYKRQENLYCIWSGKHITNKTLNVDHVLPFAHYLNNDLWNLLPAINKINSNKSDKVPTPELIEKQSDLILDYWQLLQKYFKNGFEEEVRISLVPDLDLNDISVWGKPTINALQEKAEFLIEVRGCESWNN